MEPGSSAGGSSSTSSTTGTFPACGMRVFPFCLSSSDVSSPSPSQLLTGIIVELLQLAENIPLFPRELEERRLPVPWGHPAPLCHSWKALPGLPSPGFHGEPGSRMWREPSRGTGVWGAGCGVCQQPKECSSSCSASLRWGWSRADPGAPGAAGKGILSQKLSGHQVLSLFLIPEQIQGVLVPLERDFVPEAVRAAGPVPVPHP